MKEKSDKMDKFEVIEGGKSDVKIDDAIIGGKPWIDDLDEGDTFIIKDRNPMDYVAQEFKVLDKKYTNGKLVAVQLCADLNQEVFVWIEPIRFCQKYSLIKVISSETNNE